jgi:hypothetical protein
MLASFPARIVNHLFADSGIPFRFRLSWMRSKDIKLLGSVLTGPLNGDQKLGDETDLWQGVGTSCELILADKVNIVKAGAQELFKDCH